MRILVRTLITFSLLASLALAGCGGSALRSEGGAAPSVAEQPNNQPATTRDASVPQGSAKGGEARMQTVSLSQADASQAAPVPAERKIIRNASLSVETEKPAEGQRRIASLAEQRGGFVVTSESRQHGGGDSGRAYEVVTMEVRVPSAQFDEVIGEIRGVGAVIEEKITGQDVTEEYIDLEARLRTQKALEAQLLELLKQAGKVSDALEVQRELANVRTEIERVEGRRRFLESRSSLSTVKVTLQPSALLSGASTRGFFHGVKRAFSNGIDIASAITLGLIQVIIALIPVVLLVLLPLGLLIRFFLRRLRRNRPPQMNTPAQPAPAK